ncbi:MAG: HRDC domain-containing protein, partial [Rubrobacter sp.]|nr:HRDC domain-containing protein [Rubrobacter sp.]
FTHGDDEEADPEVFERLRRWRSEQASAQKVPAYVVLHNSHIEEISTRKPRTTNELGAIKGIGLRRAARYGEEIIALIHGEAPPEAPREDESPDSGSGNGYRAHLEAAEALISVGRGADAVPELEQALESGGEEARRAVDALFAGSYRVVTSTEERE